MRGSTAGLTGTLKGESPSHYAFLSFLDTLFSMAVIAPAVVGYWRGTWELMSMYVYPQELTLSALVSLCIGFGGHFTFSMQQKWLMQTFHPDKQRLVFFGASRIYTCIYGFTCVNCWRGAWLLLDMHTEPNVNNILAITLVSIVALATMRTLRNVSAPPFSIVTDAVDGYFEVPTMFRIPSTRQNTGLYLLDCLFSVFVVGSLVVFVWRGVWVLIDLFLFPENEVFSAIGSLVLGYATTIVVFMIQPGIRWICDRISGIWRILVADIFLLMSFIGTINVWRGIWNCLNLFYLPDERELSCWSTHIICLILLVLLNCSNSILVRGVYIDAEEPAGKCVVFPIYYLRVYFQRARSRKQQQQLQLHTMACRKQDIQDCSKHQNDINYSSKMSLDGSCKYNIESVANHIESVSVPLMLERLASDENDTNLHSEV